MDGLFQLPLIFKLFEIIKDNEIDEIGYLMISNEKECYKFNKLEKKLGIYKLSLYDLHEPIKQYYSNININEIDINKQDFIKNDILLKILLISKPNYYSGYRMRKELLLSKNSIDIYKHELNFIDLILSISRNISKLSVVWHHREWIIQQLLLQNNDLNTNYQQQQQQQQQQQLQLLLLNELQLIITNKQQFHFNRNYYYYLYYFKLIQLIQWDIDLLLVQLNNLLQFIQSNPHESGIYCSLNYLFKQLYTINLNNNIIITNYFNHFLVKFHKLLLFYNNNQSLLSGYYQLLTLFYYELNLLLEYNIQLEYNWLINNNIQFNNSKFQYLFQLK
ncbi:hypothetical protein K502DRAFT_366264 [Neoconidiobolus thromboides FSU 785]|nr:hypothetical protein K502DRAFT_366264 [Neoconidiobolus thromboides FSU 785]